MKFISVLIVTLLLLIWFSHIQNFIKRCDDLETIILDSGIPGPCLGIIAGVHGNEPAASIALTTLLKTNDTLIRPKRGKIIIIPKANQCGLYENTRWHPLENRKLFDFQQYDLNRKFNEYGGTNGKSEQIIETLQNCDLILDFHEGWGWNVTTRNGWGPVSLGSSIFGTNHPLASLVAKRSVEEINKSIYDPNKKFVQLLNESCTIPSTLGCYFEKTNKAGVVIETSGQNDVQPLEVRMNQIKKVIEVAKSELMM